MGEKAVELATSLNNVTVVLLGVSDPDYQGRARYYYKQHFCQLLNVDIATRSASSQLWQEQLLAALEQIETPFAILTPDSDFLLADALAAGVDFLQNHPDFTMAQGYSIGYSSGGNEVDYYKLGSARKHNAHAVDPCERVALYARLGLQAWRSLVRVEALKAAVRNAPADLPFEGWCVAMAYALLRQGAGRVLAQTSAVVEYRPSQQNPVAYEECLNQTVRSLHQWNAETGQAGQGSIDFDVLSRFVRNTHEGCEARLLFKSCWGGVLKDPERTFEPRQFVEMPYYNAAVFEQLHALEFLLHAWPAGQRQIQALEGCWVRQQALLEVHPSDSADSLKDRYWQALSLGLFNSQVCRRLVEVLDGKDDAVKVRELEGWLERLDALGGASVQERLASTPSGRTLAAIAAATPDDAARKRVLAHLSKNRLPQIAFVLMDLDNDDAALQSTFDSLLASGLRDFKIVVLKAGELPAITTPRDTLHFIKVTAGNVVAHLNQVVRQLSSDWLMLLEAGDVLTPGGLLRLQSELGGAEGCLAICANEVQRAGDGRLVSIVRPGANLDLLRSRPDLMSRHWLLRRESVVGLEGYSEVYPQALEFDLLLRLIEQQGMGGLAHLDEYLVIGQQRREAMSVGALATLKRHLAGLGYNGQVSESVDGAFQIDFRHPVTPQVSILLPVDGDLAQLKACLVSIVQRTRYPRYEVIVVADGTNASALAGELASLQTGGRVSVLAGEPGTSRSQLINQAAAQARGEYLVLMSSRSQVASAAWIEALLNQALRPEVGVVGCLMHGREERVTHAGYELLVSGQVQGVLLGVSRFAPVLGLAQVRSCQAVSDDCLMVRKDLFSQCGGMQAVAGADIDLCLRAAQAGLLVIWTPQAQMLNDAVPALGQPQQQALSARWPSAFTTRVAACDQFGVDVSRGAGSDKPVILEWVSELA